MGDLYLKVLGLKGNPVNGGHGSWDLPNGDNPGAWRSVNGELVPCQNGLHVCDLSNAVRWIGPAFYLCEVGDEVEEFGNFYGGPDTIVARRARLVEKLEYRPRQLALDTALHFLAAYGASKKLAEAIDIARGAEGVQATNARTILGEAATVVGQASAADEKAATVVRAAIAPGVSWKAAKATLKVARKAIAEGTRSTEAGRTEAAWQSKRLGDLLGVVFE